VGLGPVTEAGFALPAEDPRAVLVARLERIRDEAQAALDELDEG
jgi:hypothetical protein